MRESKLLAAVLIAAAALFIVTASIAAPILIRPFYYIQIGIFDLEEKTGLSKAQIMQAYDEMLNFCIGLSKEFSTGVLAWSEQGRAHFVDVRRLFILDLSVMTGSGLGLLSWRLLRKKVSLRPHSFNGRSTGFWAGTGLLIVFAVVGTLAALDFGRAFTVFHHIFFPGKSNWMFSPAEDQIITILPEAFFRNCAVFIVLLILLSCGVLIALDCQWRRKRKKSFKPGNSGLKDSDGSRKI